MRNPYARFLSAVNEHVKKFQSRINLPSMTPDQRVEVVEALVRKVLTIANITTDWRFIHFSPQLWYLRLGDRTIPRHIIPMHSDGAFTRQALSLLGLPALPVSRHNPSPVDLTPALASPVVSGFVRTFYADDIAYLTTLPICGLTSGWRPLSPAWTRGFRSPMCRGANRSSAGQSNRQ